MKETGLDAVEIAEKQRHLYLLTRVKNSRHLSPSELKELKKLEQKAKNKKRATSHKHRGSKAAVAAEQLVHGQKAAAAYAGVSVRTIRNWKAEGMPVAADGGYFKGMLDFYKKNEGRQPTEERKAGLAADADYKTIRATLLQMELDVKQGKLVPFEEIERGRVNRILTVKRALLGLGRMLAPQLAKVKDEKRIAAIINTECRDMIKSFSG